VSYISQRSAAAIKVVEIYLSYAVSDRSEKEIKYFMCLSSTHI